MTRSIKTLIGTSLAALAMVAALSATPAEAYWRHRGWGGGGGGVALGLFGGLAAGAIIASQARPYRSYDSGYSAYDYPDYAPACYLERRPVVGYYGEVVGYRRVRVCN